MNRLAFLLLLFVSSLTFGQGRVNHATQAQLLAPVNDADVFVEYDAAARKFAVFWRDVTDTTTPASDSVRVRTNGTRFKRLSLINATTSSGGSVAWNDITGKPSTFTPATHNQAISTITGLLDSLNARQRLIALGTAQQYYRGDKTWATLDATAVGLPFVKNLDQSNASNLTSGSIPTGRYANATIPLAALSQSSATTGQVPIWNGSAWAAGTVSGGGGGGSTDVTTIRSNISTYYGL